MKHDPAAHFRASSGTFDDHTVCRPCYPVSRVCGLADALLEAALDATCGPADWTPAMPDDQILRRLLALNRARGGAPAAG